MWAATCSATMGMRLEPPTRTMPARSPAPSEAEAIARSRAASVSATRGRTAASNSARVMRTSVVRPGNRTAIVVSVSADSASLAATHSARSSQRGAAHVGVVAVHRPQRAVERGVDVGEHRLVEVDAAEAVEALGPPEQLGAVGAEAHDGGVERPPTEVVHGDGVAGAEAPEPGVVPRRGDRFGDERDVAEPGDAAGLAQKVELVLAPRRRMGERHLPARLFPALAAAATTWASR